MNTDLEIIGKKAREASRFLSDADSVLKRDALYAAAEELVENKNRILAANVKDLMKARQAGISEGLYDRLLLDISRINAMADGIRKVADLDDPIGCVTDTIRRGNGLLIGKMTVPLGVIGVIYESRPNVTSDVFALTFKTGNAVILKGGSDAINSNTEIARVLRASLKKSGFPEDCITLIEDTSRETTNEFMKLREYVDLMIPRGGAGLIKAVTENSTIPVIETGSGNCHIYVDEYADLEKALPIIENAKTQRLGVCNAAESLVVHSAILEKAMPLIAETLGRHNVEIRCDERSFRYTPGAHEASPEDFGREYLDSIISVKTVDSLDEAIEHINTYNTGHSESIITENYSNALRFQRLVDAACVYVNASTRFTDGGEFGFGAEIGISTQKLHARGPMGLKAITTYKYIIFGNGQIRQ